MLVFFHETATCETAFNFDSSLLPFRRGWAQNLVTDRAIGQLEVVATFSGPMPTGVTVANNGRIFVNFPKWGDDVEYTVAEVKGGKTVPYPNADINRYESGDNQADKLVSVQSVVVDPTGKRLWILDTGSIGFGLTSLGGPKLIAVDLNANKVVKKIIFPADVALPTTYLNDVRFDLHRGAECMAFITDSAVECAEREREEADSTPEKTERPE